MKQKITIIILLQLMIGTTAFAQNARFNGDPISGRPMMADADGKPLYLKSSYTAEGSPFIYDEYSDADITLTSGQVYANQKVKVNLLDKYFLYKTPDGVEMEITAPIHSIRFHAIGSGNTKIRQERILEGFGQALNAPGAPIYEVITKDSSAALLKQIIVTYIDVKPYGEVNTTRKFKHNETYFAAVPPGNKQLKKIEKSKSAVAAIFGSQSSAVIAFINQKKLKCKSEEELVEVFKYYGTL
ncbi:MAG: hypothetical protein ABW007_20710 [Chitinophagaceae bacterium]